AKHAGHALNLLAVALRPQRANRAVDQTADQDRVVTGAAFTLNKTAAADLAGCIEFLFVINAQRKVVHAADAVLADHSRAQHDSVTVGHQHAGAGAETDTVDLELERLAAQLGLDGDDVFVKWINGTHTWYASFYRTWLQGSDIRPKCSGNI